MKQQLSMTILVTPVSVQKGARFGRGRFYTDKKKLLYYGRIETEAKIHAPIEPITGPIEVEWRFYMDRPRKYLGKKYPEDSFPCIEKPDLFNLVKGAEDALTKAGVWVDDKQIWHSSVSKFYRETDMPPRIELTITYDDGIIKK